MIKYIGTQFNYTTNCFAQRLIRYTSDEPSSETIRCVIKLCSNILYHRFYYHLLYQFWY